MAALGAGDDAGVERGEINMVAAQAVASRVNGKVDADIVSRFATCCRALGLVVYDRQRPADGLTQILAKFF